MSKAFDVGYGRPPKHGQFRKGQSGNPKGRPKGTKNLITDLTEELSEKITLTENGKPKTISKQRALIKSLTAQSIKGDPRAIAQFIRLILPSLGIEDTACAEVKPSESDEKILADFIERSQIEQSTTTDNQSDDGGHNDAQ